MWIRWNGLEKIECCMLERVDDENWKSALRANDIARVLDLSEKQIYKMAATGEIPSLRIANSVRFDPHDFAEWLRTRSSAPEIEPKARVSAPRSRPKLDRSARHNREI